MVFLNPVISFPKGSEEAEEGCLSLPGLYGNVIRPKQVRVNAYSLDGKEFHADVTGLMGALHPARNRPPRRRPLHRPDEPHRPHRNRLRPARIRNRVRKADGQRGEYRRTSKSPPDWRSWNGDTRSRLKLTPVAMADRVVGKTALPSSAPRKSVAPLAAALRSRRFSRRRGRR